MRSTSSSFCAPAVYLVKMGLKLACAAAAVVGSVTCYGCVAEGRAEGRARAGAGIESAGAPTLPVTGSSMSLSIFLSTLSEHDSSFSLTSDRLTASSSSSHNVPVRAMGGRSGGCAAGSAEEGVSWFEHHGLCLALHRHFVPPLSHIEELRHAAPPVELRPRLEAADAHAAAPYEAGRRSGGGGRWAGGVLPDQLGNGGRRAAVRVAQLAAGTSLQQLLHTLRVALVSGIHQGGVPISVLQVDVRLVLDQQVHYGALARQRSHHESGLILSVAQVDAGTAPQQLLHHAQVLTMHGCHESGKALDGAQVDAGTEPQQLLHRMQPPSSRSRVQQPGTVLG
eukprot:scaffold45353_cov61-Phaeocystis_antarctica.AAC.2